MENPTLERIVNQPHPDLAAAIRLQSSRIFARFQTVVKEVLPAADKLTFSELNDGLPDAMENLALAIAQKQATVRHFMADSSEHGACRFHQSFNLGELLIEYSILRTIILEEVTYGLGRPLTTEELCGLNAGIDASSRKAVESFVRHQAGQVQSATEAQSKYLSFLSHDLRGSLNGILLMVEVLRRELGPTGQFESSIEDLETMKRSILDTVGTMDRFLHAEKFRKGKVEVRLANVNIESLLPDLASQFLHHAERKGVKLKIENDQCPRLSTDRELISLILQNLISNAVKYSNKGTVRVFARINAEGIARLGVSDEGPGMSPERMAELFTPFTRGETHGEKGTGLGLSMAHQAAELLGARLWADSKLGDGTTFTLELPPAATRV